MASNVKMTAFGKFVIFLLIAAPIAYFGSKYLENQGVLDNIKDKIDQPGEANTPKRPTEEDILKDLNQNNQSQEDIIAEQKRKIEELQRQNEALKNESTQGQTTTSSSGGSSNSTPGGTSSSSSSSSSSTDRTINGYPADEPANPDAPSFDDLMAEAEGVFREKGKNSGGTTGTSNTSPSLNPPSTEREALASWSFTFQGVNGVIAFYREGDRIMAHTQYGNGRKDISELSRNGDRFIVRGSPTGEYYELRSDGNLDAYDRSGFQTTCRRR